LQGTAVRTLILASSSPRRQELIRTLGQPVIVLVNGVDESVPQDWEPSRIVEELALRKADAVYVPLLTSKEQDGIVVGSDTIVVRSGEVLGKPTDPEDAKRMLSLLQGSSHEVYSGVACLDLSTGNKVVRHRMTRVAMKPLTPEQIAGYVSTGEPMDKAGAYGIQGLGSTIVDSIEGDYFTVVGLPLSLLSEMLQELGLDILSSLGPRT